MILLAICGDARAADPEKPYLLHLPGIGGHMAIDNNVMWGMTIGGVDAKVQIHDWTNGNPGLPSLMGYARNQVQAGKISEIIIRLARANPGRRIIITTHSGGGAMAIWALEKLPEDVRIDTLVMLAPALSPTYDLSKALAHVKGKAYAFTSTLDPINGIGTRGLGTMDRVKTDAAGNVGFSKPQGADDAQYAKLVGIPYNSDWMKYGNAGDHIGTMTPAFACAILAPLIVEGRVPAPPASQPAALATP